MNQKLEGLWLGGEISREAAEFIDGAVFIAAKKIEHDPKLRTELIDLANAIRAQIQKLPPPMSDLV